MSFALKFPSVSHIGHRVSHAKNRSKHPFRRNLHTVTILTDGIKQKLRVPTQVLRQLKRAGVTTHHAKAVEAANR